MNTCPMTDIVVLKVLYVQNHSDNDNDHDDSVSNSDSNNAK